MADKPKPQRLPGTEGANKELEDLAYKYAAHRDARMAAGDQEVEAKQELLQYMHDNEINTYKYEDLVVERIPGEEKLKVKVVKEKSEEAA